MANQDSNVLLTKSYAQLLSLAVHEFRTPVSVVGGYLRMLQRDTEHPLSDRHRKMVEEAERSCARIVALIGELNEVSKLDDPIAPLPEEPFDLFAVIREVAGETHEASDRGVQLKMRGPSSGAPLKGDLVRVHRALSSLVRAVLREQQDDGIVIVDCQLKRDRSRATAVVAIANDAEVAAALEAAPTTFDERRGGLGLILPIARRVIEHHGGQLWSPPSEKAGFGSKSAVVLSIPVLAKG
ncbi:MAG TPA: HAMP domain-containing sensor histidine kinase [Vicinamibacterales bacterium]